MKNKERASLIKAARAVQGELKLRGKFSAGDVGAAILTSKGNIYTGICIDLACGLGFCAEVAAIAEMLKNGESQIAAVVAVSDNIILPPCGRCRETMAQINEKNLDCRVVLSEDSDVSLQKLLPRHWLENKKDKCSIDKQKDARGQRK